MRKAHDLADASAPAGQGAAGGSPSFGDDLSLLSHDLRSALSDILGGLGLIDDTLLPPAERLQLQRARSAAKSLVPLVDTCLAIRGSGKEGKPRAAVRTDLAQFLREIAARWKGRATEKGLGFRLDKGADLPPVIHCDRDALDRILANFLSNAIKHAGQGEIVLGVDRMDRRHLRFTVADNGPGLSPEARERLFEYHGRPADSPKPGEGLGLFIAHELARRIGGSVSVENRSEGGVVASLTLPLAPPREGTAEGRRATFKALPDLSGLKVLVAEDNATNQIVVTQMLETLGAAPALAADGIEALDLVRRESFDFALLDIEMPRMSGLELIRTIRQMTGPAARMPLIAFTAYVMPEHRARILEAGADGIIAKPLTSIAEFGAAIESHIARHRGNGADADGSKGADAAVPAPGAGNGKAAPDDGGGARPAGPRPSRIPNLSPSSPPASSAMPQAENERLGSRTGPETTTGRTASRAPRESTASPPLSDQRAPTLAAGTAPVNRRTFEMLLQSVGAATVPTLLEKLSEDLAACHEALETAVAATDPLAVREQTHILMSLAGAVGARPAQSLARQLNAAAHQEDAAAMARLGNALLSQLRELRAFIAEMPGAPKE